MQSDDLSPQAPRSGREAKSPLAGDTIDRLLTAQLDPSEAERIQAFLQESPARQRLLDQLRGWIRRDEATWTAVEREQLWEAVRGAISPTHPRTDSRVEQRDRARVISPSRPILRTFPRGVWYSLAGVIAGVLAIVAGWHIGAPRFHTWGGRQQVLTYVTGNAERANIVLPDGGTVTLNVASRLEVPVDYASGNRSVALQGEAMFTVPHRSGAPFTVAAGATTTRVLGTSFLVRHYATDRTTTVAVRDGKVTVHVASAPTVILTAAQQVEGGVTTLSEVQTADPAQFSFASGILTFKGVPLPDAIVELNRWYDADIRLGASELRTQRLTGEYAAGTLVELTEMLRETFNVRVVRSGRVLTLFPR